jgi:hypothetical protein
VFWLSFVFMPFVKSKRSIAKSGVNTLYGLIRCKSNIGVTTIIENEAYRNLPANIHKGDDIYLPNSLPDKILRVQRQPELYFLHITLA